MNIRLKYACLILLGCLCNIPLIAQTHSFQVWTGLETSAAITNKLSFDFSVETRFQQNSATLKQASAEIGARYSITKPLFVVASYEFADKYKGTSYFPVHTFAAAVGYKKKLGDWRLSARTKLNAGKTTYIKKAEDERFDFVDKNKIKVAYNGFSHIQPSVFVETYHPMYAGSNFHVSTVKYSANCSFKLRKHFNLDFGYMFRHEIDDKECISIATITLGKEW